MLQSLMLNMHRNHRCRLKLFDHMCNISKDDPINLKDDLFQTVPDSTRQGDQTPWYPLCQKPATRRGPLARRPLPCGFWGPIKQYIINRLILLSLKIIITRVKYDNLFGGN